MDTLAATRDPKLEAVLSRYMNACALRGPVYALAETGSTMEDARALAEEGAPEGTLVFAARQSRGRGRLGRSWVSPQGGAYCSAILRPPRPAAEMPQLALVAGLSVVEGLRQLVPALYPAIRWPNDVLVDTKKLAGILLEASGQRSAESVQRTGRSPHAERSTLYAVLGVGINVARTPSGLSQTAIALDELVPRCPHPHQVIGAFWRRLAAWYDVWVCEGFGPVREALRPWMGHFGQVVKITTGGQGKTAGVEYHGQAVDLDERGRLVVRLDAGLHRAFEAGEVTLLRSRDGDGGLDAER